MFEIGSKSVGTIRIRQFARMLRLGLLLFFSVVSARSSPLHESKPAEATVISPGSYCLGNVASLGSGLVRSPITTGTTSSSRKSIRWTGWIRASATGKYEFSLQENGTRIIVNKQQIFERSAMTNKSEVIEIELSTNRFYAITVETPNIKGSTLPLRWRRPDGRQEIVPTAYLYPPLETASVTETEKL